MNQDPPSDDIFDGPMRVVVALAVLLSLQFSARPARAQPFTDLGEAFGLPSQPLASSSSNLLAAVSMADLDGDGELDLVANTPSADLAIYYRRGDVFELSPPLLTGPRPFAETFGHALVDMDHDGDLDLVVGRGDGDKLFENTSQGFVDVTETHLPQSSGWTSAITAADLDGDGDSDLLVARYIERVDFPAHRCFENRILENDGRGYFRDITFSAGLAKLRGCSFATIALDFDDDLDLDILTINDFTQFTGRTELWRNNGRQPNGEVAWTEVSAELGLDVPLYGMGAAFDDIDQNGRPDLLISNIGEPMRFEWSPDDHRFFPVSGLRQLYTRFAHDRHQVTWTVRFEDIDADGHLDVLAAGGNLPAAPFIGNPTDMGSLFLRGTPDGRLLAVPLADDFPRARHSARDFHFADIDHDGRPEIIAAHIHGGISIYRNDRLPPVPTVVELSPTLTGPDAAGARLTLTCGEETVTRRFSAGGDYGNAPETSARIYWRQCPPGKNIDGRVRWPSGFVQHVTLQSGHTAHIEEPSWLTWVDDEVLADLSAHEGVVAELSFGGTNLRFESTSLENRNARKFATRAIPLDPMQDSILDLRIDGRLWGAHPRRRGDGPVVRANPTHVISGRQTTFTIAWLRDPGAAVASFTDFPGPPITLSPFDAERKFWSGRMTVPDLTDTGPPTSHIMHLQTSSGAFDVPVVIEPAIDLERSELLTRELHILSAEANFRRLRLRFRLLDRNGEPADIDLDRLGLTLNGLPIEPDDQLVETGLPTLVIEHTRLFHGARIEATLDGLPILEAQTVLQFDNPSSLGEFVSPETSRCFVSESRLRADGADRGTALIQFNDATGNRLPDFDVRPSLEGELITPLRDSLVRGFSGWSVEFEAGLVPGRARLYVSLPAMAAPLSCTVELVSPPILPEPSSPSTLIALGEASVGEPLIIRFWPLDVSGRSLGSGVKLSSEVTNVSMASGLDYVGLGRYEQGLVPRAPGPLEVLVESETGRELARLELIVGTGETTEPGPEPSPEVTEEVAAPDIPETEGETTDDVPSPAEVVEPSPLEDADVSEFTVEIADEVESVELDDRDTSTTRSKRDGGCASSGRLSISLGTWLGSLMLVTLFWRRRPNASCHERDL